MGQLVFWGAVVAGLLIVHSWECAMDEKRRIVQEGQARRARLAQRARA